MVSGHVSWGKKKKTQTPITLLKVSQENLNWPKAHFIYLIFEKDNAVDMLSFCCSQFSMLWIKCVVLKVLSQISKE